MKINPLEWNQVDETTFPAQGLLLLRSSQPFGLEVEAFGVAVTVGAETTHRIPLSQASKVTLLGGKAPIYRKIPEPRYVVSNEETFVNIDRLPQESGTMLEVTKAVRLMKIEERATIRRIREEREISDAVIASRKAAKDAEEKSAKKAEEKAAKEAEEKAAKEAAKEADK